MKLMREQVLRENDLIVSFDVVSLPTNVQTDLAVEVAGAGLYSTLAYNHDC